MRKYKIYSFWLSVKDWRWTYTIKAKNEIDAYKKASKKLKINPFHLRIEEIVSPSPSDYVPR